MGVLFFGTLNAAMFLTVAGDELANPCPDANAIDNYYTNDIVDAGFTAGGGTATFWLDSTDQDPTTGVPGLSHYCVFTDEDNMPDSATNSYSTFELYTKNVVNNPDGFGWQRQAGGNGNNIPFDGDNDTVGTATWNGGSVPSGDLVVILHIQAPDECDRLYGDNPFSCFVYASSDDTHRRTPPPPCIDVSGAKLEDMDGNGAADEGDSGLGGWTVILLLDGDVVDSTTTADDGSYSFTHLCGQGDYSLEEELVDGWVQTYPAGGSHDFTTEGNQDITGLEFMNYALGCIGGTKFIDADHDGEWDEGEHTYGGLAIELHLDGELFADTTTGDDGSYSFCGLGPGTYTVVELLPETEGTYMVWAQTYPGGEGVWTIPGQSGMDVTDADFGNACEYTGGLTWGYWQTHTGVQESKKGPKAPKDATYDLLASNPMPLDLPTADSDYQLDGAGEAYTVLRDVPNSCSGDCRNLFRAQLISLWMSVLKFDGMSDAVYTGPGDYNGWTVQDILDAGVALLTGGGSPDFTSFQVTLNDINNNGHYADGDHVLVCGDHSS